MHPIPACLEKGVNERMQGLLTRGEDRRWTG